MKASAEARPRPPATMKASAPSAAAVALPPEALEAMRHYLNQASISALLASDEPLGGAERQALEDGLRWWREQLDVARWRVLTISARLSGSVSH